MNDHPTPTNTPATESTKPSLDGIAKQQILEAEIEWARKLLDRETLAEQKSGQDFFETSVWAIRDLIRHAIEAGYRDGLHAGYRQGRADACSEAKDGLPRSSPRNPELPTN